MSLHITESENEITDDIQGDLARIGSNDLLCSDPEVIRYMSSARANWHRSDWYDAMSLDVYCDNVISTKHPVTHDQLRSKLIQGVRYISFCIVKKGGERQARRHRMRSDEASELEDGRREPLTNSILYKIL